MNDGGFMAVSPHSSNIVFYTGNVYNAGYFIGVSHTTDGGATWGHDTIPLASRGWAVAFDPVDSNRVYVGGDSAYSYPALLITTDLGVTWTMSRTGLEGAVNVLEAAPDGTIFAGTNNGLFRSTDDGATWSRTGLTQQVRALVLHPASPAHMFAGTYGAGVYASTDGGVSWSEMSEGLTCRSVLSLALHADEGTLFAGTEGGAVFLWRTITGLAGSPPVAPRQLPLNVSPNPCRGVTTVSLGAPPRDPAHLDIYNAAGCCVFTSDVRTSSFVLRTSSFPPGAYFVRLVAGPKTRTARLTVLE